MSKTLGDRALLTLVKSLYLNPKNVSTAFASPYRIYKYLKKANYKISLTRVVRAMEHIVPYQLHKESRARFKRQPVLARGQNELHQADLVDLSRIKKFNNGRCFVLNVIDVFSKRVSLVSLLSKSNTQVIKGFEQVYSKRQLPRKLQTDQGMEFFGKQTSKWLHNKGIIHYASFSIFKAAIVERSNKSFLSVLHRYFTAHNTKRYIEFLPKLEDMLNNRYHRSIKMTPNQVNHQNESQVFNNLYSAYFKKRKSPAPLPIGSKVRVSKYRSIFSKKYLPAFSGETFMIDSVRPRKNGIHEYYLIDGAKNPILGKYYLSDLSLVRE